MASGVRPAEVEVFEINGSFCFGAAQKFSEVVSHIRSRPRVVILRMRHVLAIDATGLRALEEVASRFRRESTVLLLSGIHSQPLETLTRSGALGRIGEEYLFATFGEVVDRARTLVAGRRDREGTTGPVEEPRDAAGHEE